MNKNKTLYLILVLLAIPVIIYFYFLKWKTTTIYGDDLYIFKDHSALNGLSEKINIPLFGGKYRPVHGLSLHLLIESFQKNLNGYYLFNIGIQTINTFIFALILHLFLRSLFFSIFFSLIVGVSRFSFFNIVQLLNGGALEGLAMTFFLAALYFILKALTKNNLTSSQKQRAILWSILFANLSMYTHERYIVFFPFILLILIVFQRLNTLMVMQRIGLGVVILASVILNILIKKWVYSMPFFVGTASTDITFSFSSATSYFIDSILSIFQINSGPAYLVGISFFSLSVFNKALVILVAGGSLMLFTSYLYKLCKTYTSRKEDKRFHLYIFILLGILFVLLLLPAIVTIRLEQRWLQASFSIFILMIVIALNNLHFRNIHIKNYLFSLFIVFFLWTDFNYLYKGANNFYMMDSERLASAFKQAISKNIIRSNTRKLYIWEKLKDVNSENAIRWIIGDGYFFEFYQNRNKKIIFVDSIYQKSYSFPVSSFLNFNEDNEQIIYIKNNIIDITSGYLKDSLKSFDEGKLVLLSSDSKIQYNQKHLTINNDDFNKFSTKGFYDNENGMRWTNGNASIGFMGDYRVKDSLSIELNTYMPPVCKDIVPKILLIDFDNKNYQPVLSIREGDKFLFKFFFEKTITIQEINILSETIGAHPPDVRVLSFPFISLEIKK